MSRNHPDNGELLRRLYPDFVEIVRVDELSPRSTSVEPVQMLGVYLAEDGSQVNVAVFAPVERACAAVLACVQPNDAIRVTGVRELTGHGRILGGKLECVAAEIVKILGVVDDEPKLENNQ